jgi:hypothetical protein
LIILLGVHRWAGWKGENGTVDVARRRLVRKSRGVWAEGDDGGGCAHGNMWSVGFWHCDGVSEVEYCFMNHL